MSPAKPAGILPRGASGIRVQGSSTTVRHHLQVPLLLLSLAACQSSGSRAVEDGAQPASAQAGADAAPLGPAVRVTYRTYKSGQLLELLSESHTSRAAVYSKRTALGQATTKIADDDLMTALVDALEGREIDLDAGTQEGRAPRDGRGFLWQMMEIEDDSGTRHFVIGRGSDQSDVKRMNKAVQAFMGAYNLTQGFQVIENPGGLHLFGTTPGTGQ